ncbi:isoflavone reductase-like protein [Canna indica]|uniref:Isoflavone reductase-like protein n=1 Tax=Canna indica TaxID=4628 RepID=A0AAQ3L123_9LILI|nr:isoflavone reductase-like protein [Canna indica]
MGYLNRVWMAASVAVMQSHTDHGITPSQLRSLHRAGDRLVSATAASAAAAGLVIGRARGGAGAEERRKESDDSLRKVMAYVLLQLLTHPAGSATVVDGETPGGFLGALQKFKLGGTRRRMAAEKSKILIIGGTGYIGKFVVAAAARLGHPTFALVRDTAPSDPAKAKLLDDFKASGVTLLQGDLYDQESLVKAIKQVDVVISTVGFGQIVDQSKILDAIKEAGNIKRFFPSEFGNDVDRLHAVDPAKSTLELKAQFRRKVEASGIPYTFVSSNFFAGYFLPTIGQAGATGLPTDKVTILADGNVKGIFVDEVDIGTYTVKAADDPRTLNKILYLRPSANTLTHNELVSLWEKKVGKTFERVYVPEEEVLKQIQEGGFRKNVALSIMHSVFVKGDQTNFEIDPSIGVEATTLYPDVKYTTVDEYLNRFL